MFKLPSLTRRRKAQKNILIYDLIKTLYLLVKWRREMMSLQVSTGRGRRRNSEYTRGDLCPVLVGTLIFHRFNNLGSTVKAQIQYFVFYFLKSKGIMVITTAAEGKQW